MWHIDRRSLLTSGMIVERGEKGREAIFTAAVYLSRQIFLKPVFSVGLCLKCQALEETHSQLGFLCHWNPL